MNGASALSLPIRTTTPAGVHGRLAASEAVAVSVASMDHNELLLPLAVCIVPTAVVVLLTWIFDSSKPTKKFPTAGRKPEKKSA